MTSRQSCDFFQTQIQNDRRLLRLQISPAQSGRETFDELVKVTTPFPHFGALSNKDRLSAVIFKSTASIRR